MPLVLGILIVIIIALLAGTIASVISFGQHKAVYLQDIESLRLDLCRSIINNYAFQSYILEPELPRVALLNMMCNGRQPAAISEAILAVLEKPGNLELGSCVDTFNRDQTVYLPKTIRDKHMYIVGKSGFGKTNFMRNLIRQDLRSGAGLAVVAPELELIEQELLLCIPSERIKDVVYFNPTDLAQPVVLNPLHLFEGDDIDLVVDETFTIIQRIVGDGGARMDEILRNSLYALAERPGSSLLDIEPLLDREDATLRNEVIRTTKEEMTRRFFASTYPQLGRDAHIPILNRIGRILRSRVVRNCLCPSKDTPLSQQEISARLLNVRKAMDDGKILLFNLSDGRLGHAASQLLGQLIVSKFQTATMSRADIRKESRRPFYLYLDEFQNFCGTAAKSYETILSRARKYGLGMILAHQQTGQIPTELLNEIFGCVSTFVSFQVSYTDAKRLSNYLITKWDSEPVDVSTLTSLDIGQACCKFDNFRFMIHVPRAWSGKSGIEEKIIAHSRNTWGIPQGCQKDTGRSDTMGSKDEPFSDLDPNEVF